MTTILITGGGGAAASNFRNALELTGRDYRVVASDASPYHLELLDADARYLVPTATEPGYLDAINEIIEAESVDFVHPQPDIEVAVLAEHRDKLAAPVFLPDASAVALCHDKMAFNAHLKSSGVAVPEAVHVTSQDELRKAIGDLLVIAPRVWLRAIRGAGSRASLPIDSYYQGDAWIDY